MVLICTGIRELTSLPHGVFSVLATRLAGKSIPKMTCFVSSATLSIYSMSQSILEESSGWCRKDEARPLIYICTSSFLQYFYTVLCDTGRMSHPSKTVSLIQVVFFQNSWKKKTKKKRPELDLLRKPLLSSDGG